MLASSPASILNHNIDETGIPLDSAKFGTALAHNLVCCGHRPVDSAGLAHSSIETQIPRRLLPERRRALSGRDLRRRDGRKRRVVHEDGSVSRPETRQACLIWLAWQYRNNFRLPWPFRII